ncbi:MAG: 2-succinyl-5-enolpyruvyl-6-hydroxy-3-cyclohexene-1-carboxylic-acid synthase [Chitinophagales bacterium]|nr:2-succinyl-5-enolpyruvyl-6-hydroxy-3-cyclohexene-1-carboxylic-acid synthase [Chitinophagales bacterium]MDW8272875.1 2-succinyl-5-enolpyruvyl-6-hydroxy-3-cyclohexene-1-carboxylic-acid synthase [Chitinophagales bacterium]
MTSHLHVQLIADYLNKRKVHHVIICPGSRSAPLVIAFNYYPDIKKYVITDERSAGYFALGLAKQLRRPIAIVCTSGTAVLNLGPALCEAFHQAIPLIAITADRPEELQNIGENQTINQHEIFSNYTGTFIKFSPIQSLDDFTRLIPVMDACLSSDTEWQALPSHWNVHIPEPLYDIAGEEVPYYELPELHQRPSLEVMHTDEIELLQSTWSNTDKKMIICGYADFTTNEIKALKELEEKQDIVLLSEHASNLPFHFQKPWNIDALLQLISPQDEKNFAPEVVITIGRQILSNKLKKFLRKNKPKLHFHLSPLFESWNQFLLQDGFYTLPIQLSSLLTTILTHNHSGRPHYKQQWEVLHDKVHNHTHQFCSLIPFSDLKAFKLIFDQLPVNSILHLGNSSPVRYAQFFPLPPSIKVFSNRGTGGIDGCLSTAVGSAFATKKILTAIIGDLGFFYDSNALWNKKLPNNLRIIVINNGGGNIFRLIDGPQTVRNFEEFFEASHNLTARHLSDMFGLEYYFSKNEIELKNVLPDFFERKGGAALLEIKTNNKTSAVVYKDYFSGLKK